LVAHFQFSPFETQENYGSTMASSSRQKKKNQDKQSTFQDVVEGWFAEMKRVSMPTFMK